ncbi:MAG: hypothetical protein Pg6C_12090 [Treponemataceae bacterium]|nr:MAG: hypothetical protein Pg6C_12090 [Treponemataceae bacterium]
MRLHNRRISPPPPPPPGNARQSPQNALEPAEPQDGISENTENLASTALTASRLSELAEMPGLPQWSSLVSDTLQGDSLESGSINTALKTLLSRLETLEKTLPLQTNMPAVKSEFQIRRFKINGNDILPSCRWIYCLKIDPSGIFLITGDRKFTYNQQIYDETFYFLFKPRTAQQGNAMYDTAVSVSNEESAVQSYLKLLANQSPLSASRTGNFVTIRSEENNFNIELLIDLGD